jgi:filamentous hemagglutinin family protein
MKTRWTTDVSDLVAIVVCCLSLALPLTSTQTQAANPITPSVLNTEVSSPISLPSGKVQYDITGGTRPGGGANLFHSFGDFNVPNNNIANFLNDSGLATSNILGRVTGGNPSTIFGTIQTTDFGNANLFLMNPTGFLFGPNATVNVGGMVAFTTADYLRLANGVLFNATSNAAADALLSAAPVAAFGFLGSNAAAIAIQGSTLQVAQGQSLSFVGGNQGFTAMNPDTGNPISVPGGVTMTGGKLTAPGGQINLASVASGGEILSSNLQLGANVDGTSFTSLGDITISQDALIDTAGPIGGTIAIRGGQLTIRDGATIATAASSDPVASAGSVTINGAGVQMTGSDVVISGTNVSVTGSQVTAAKLDGSGGTIAITAGSTDQPGNVSVTQNALLNASGTSGGSITIRGGQLTIADATLSANTGNTPGVLTAIDIDVTGDISITDTRAAPAITATTTGTGKAGAVQIASANMRATSTDPNFARFALIDTHSSGDGRGGDVTITTGNLTVTGPAPTWYFIDSGPQGAGHGGDITITASNHIQLDDTYISTGTQTAELLGLAPSTSAGNLSIKADSLQTKNVLLDTHASTVFEETQSAGDITLNIRDISMVETQVVAFGVGRGGAIAITADRLIATDNTLFQTFNILVPGSGITFTGRILELSNGSSWNTSAFGDFKAGDILVNATDHVSLIGITNEFGQFNPSGLFSNSLGGAGTQGAAGNIVVATPRLTMQEGRINTSTATSGPGSDVTINAGVIEMSGEFPNPDIGGFFGITNIHPSGIFTQTVGSEFCSGPCGNAGNINITTGSLLMGAGSQINSGTTNTGRGGDITIYATDTISLSGSLSDGSPVGVFSRTIGTEPGSGSGGNIALTAGQSVTISDGASISASSTGPGNTGNIQINAGNQFTMANSTVTTDADHASGGNIKITTSPEATVWLQDSKISASVADGPGGGGNISIDPQYVILQNSQILARAADGQGGAITITANLFLPDANSIVNADSGSGVHGTVTIQSPNAPASGKIQPLGKSPLQATSLLSQRCAALAGGEFSSFTVAGRDSLPTEPGSWLTSPLYAAGVGEGQGVRGKGLEGMTLGASPAKETPLLSLRQIAPVGFLTQAFAVDWSAGCQS